VLLNGRGGVSGGRAAPAFSSSPHQHRGDGPMADTDKPRVFTRVRERDGKELTRVAHSEADVVKFQFDGWSEVTGSAATKAVAAEQKAAADAAKAEAKAADTTKK
jgi:translation initiation factor IF-2